MPQRLLTATPARCLAFGAFKCTHERRQRSRTRRTPHVVQVRGARSTLGAQRNRDSKMRRAPRRVLPVRPRTEPLGRFQLPRGEPADERLPPPLHERDGLRGVQAPARQGTGRARATLTRTVDPRDASTCFGASSPWRSGPCAGCESAEKPESVGCPLASQLALPGPCYNCVLSSF